ncbi:MAG: UDP-N-acetylglucosamine 2-epimerase (non-hydrolyzing) [Oscillospiraceae bacterium]|jgi:UDP-N-acetylglucosamine 2-epimerase|nr:UDP-N-acetylglucosamine 2-epimerase (non-hydrolyzing) [Oscillospiraceae bacterium]
MGRIKVLLVFGTRPDAIKMAPLYLELKRRPEFECLACVTAQHRKMLDDVLDAFGIKPDYDLDLMKEDQTLAYITAGVLTGLGEVLRREKPALVLVHGDTTTAFSAALAAFYEKIPVGHVEAGLRSYDRYFPFPEEMNRCLAGRLAEYHFAPTARNAENLRRENIMGKIFITGNTVIDAMKYTVGDGAFKTPALAALNFTSRRVIVMTCHRRESYGEAIAGIFRAVRRVAESFDDVSVVYPVHLSPYIRETASKILGGAPNILLIDPLDAAEMHRLISKCFFVMTDSGGLQEEAPALGKPVLVLRRETERPEAVESGTVSLAGVDENAVYTCACALLNNDSEYDRMARAVNPYGDGNACPRIADAISHCFGGGSARPEDFCP